MRGNHRLALQPGRRRHTIASRTARWLLLTLAATVPAAGQTPPDGAPPAVTADAAPASFLIETIRIRGLGSEAAQEIVRSESQLSEGRTYSERELRDAVHRVRRLPFVVGAEMDLGRGSERGAYELVISVDAAKPVGYAVDAFGGILPHQSFETVLEATIGARKFIGRRGVLFGSVQGVDVAGVGRILQAGYTRYGVLRPGSFVTAAVSSQVGSDYLSRDVEAALLVGLPLVGNHAARAGLSWAESSQDTRLIRSDTETRSAELQWIYDDTDDPLVPLEGLRTSVRALYSHQDTGFQGSSPVEREGSQSEEWQLRLDGRRYWPVATHRAFGIGVAAQHTESELASVAGRGSDEDVASLELLHAVSLLRQSGTQRNGDLRLETSAGLEVFREDSQRSREAQHSSNALFRATLTYRHAWGLLRFNLLFLVDLGGDQ